MVYHRERKWMGRGGLIASFFARRGFIRLTSGKNKSLLGSDDNSSAYLQFGKDCTGDFEDIRKRNVELQRRLDELSRMMDALKTENEAHVKLETEKCKRTNATLKAEIRKNIDRIVDLEGKFVTKTQNMEKISEIEIRNDALEGEIKKLKERIIFLEVNSIQNTIVECTSLPSPPDLEEMEEMDLPASFDELYTWIISLVLVVGFLIGMQI